MSQNQIESQSFADLQQQIKELRQLYISEIEKLQSETRLLLADQQRRADVLKSRFSHQSKQISNCLWQLEKSINLTSLDS